MVKIGRISLNSKDLTKFFSPNEVLILKLLWGKNTMTSAEIQKEYPDLSLACISGTLDRLVKSDFVTRKIDGSNERLKYIYSAVGDRRDVGLRISEKVIESLVETFGESTISMLGKQLTKRRKK